MAAAHEPVSTAKVSQASAALATRTAPWLVSFTRPNEGTQLLPRIDPVYYYGRFIWHLSYPIVRLVDMLTEVQIRRAVANPIQQNGAGVARSELRRESVDAR